MSHSADGSKICTIYRIYSIDLFNPACTVLHGYVYMFDATQSACTVEEVETVTAMQIICATGSVLTVMDKMHVDLFHHSEKHIL